MTATPSLWVVVRLAPFGANWGKEPTFYATTGTNGIPQRAVYMEDAARTLAAELEAVARRTTPLTAFLNLSHSVVVGRYFEALRDLGLAIPDHSLIGAPVQPAVERRRGGTTVTTYGPEHANYQSRLRQLFREWWPTVAATITPDTNAKLWDALFPEHRFYAVHRVPIEE